MEKTMVIFGGADHEEAAARGLARKFDCVLATATEAGKKVAASNAYKADGFQVDEGDFAEITQVVIFECARAAAGELNVVAVCDHHNPGDLGFNLGANLFWQASSLGQLYNFLAVPEELKMIAAGDHCPADAYAGKCPGVDPVKFYNFRLEEKVKFYATSNPKTADEIRAMIETAKQKLLDAPVVDGVRDLRTAGKIDELPEAALSIGEAYMASLPDTDRDRKLTGNTKYVLGGHTTPEAVIKFMEWGNSLPNKVGKAYGNPVRGFAGVVVAPEPTA